MTILISVSRLSVPLQLASQKSNQFRSQSYPNNMQNKGHHTKV